MEADCAASAAGVTPRPRRACAPGERCDRQGPTVWLRRAVRWPEQPISGCPVHPV